GHRNDAGFVRGGGPAGATASKKKRGQHKDPVAALDSSMFESHGVSRYFENRRRQNRVKSGGKPRRKPTWASVNRRRSKTTRRLPKLSLAVHAASHLILAARATTGLGNDHPHFVPLLQRAASRMSLSL